MLTIGVVRVLIRTGSSSSTQSQTYSNPSSTRRSGVSQVSVRRGPEPAARPLAGKDADRRGSLADVVPFVGDLLHALLGKAVADKLPSTVERSAGDRLVMRDGRAVDGEHGADPVLVE